MDERISAVIETIVAENTFTPAALKTMQDALEKVKKFEIELEDRGRTLSDYGTEIKELRTENSRLVKKIDTVEETEKALVEREKLQSKIEKDEAVAKGKAEVWEKAFSLVFRNTIVRNNILGSTPIVDGGSNGYVTQQPNNSTEEVTEE